MIRQLRSSIVMVAVIAAAVVVGCGRKGSATGGGQGGTRPGQGGSAGTDAGGSSVGGAVTTGTGGGAGGEGGSSGPSSDAAVDGPFRCVYEDKLYDVGQTRSLNDGCNYCVCDANYKMFVCTGRMCGTGGAGGATGTGGTTGTGGVAGTGGATGTGGTTSACGDPEVKARYRSCSATVDSASCADLGGTWRWTVSGYAGTCECPTGEGGCPCTAQSDCLALCGANLTNPLGGPPCADVRAFTCLPTGGKAGCWCRPEDPPTDAHCPP